MADTRTRIINLPEATTLDSSMNFVEDSADGSGTRRITYDTLKGAINQEGAVNLAPAYSNAATYNVGDFCTYQGTLYSCNTQINTAEDWTPAHWTAVNMSSEVSQLNSKLTAVTTVRMSRQLFDRSLVKSGYVTLSGEVYDSPSYDYYMYLYVGDHTGRTLYFSRNGVAENARFICAYDANKSPVQSSGATSTPTYTIPEGIDFLAITWSKNSAFQCEWDRITVRTDYFDVLEPNTNKDVSTVCFGGMVAKTGGDLGSGESFSLTSVASKKNNVFVFYGKIGTFTGIRIGQGLGLNRGYNVHITPTGISWQNGTTDGSPIQHGLTIKDYIGVVIDIDNSQVSHVTISTNGGEYTRNVVPWLGNSSDIFATADDGTELTECVFSFTVKDVKKPIWYFGDSYISIATTRWPYYINELGYLENILLDGYSGAPSNEIYPDVERLFALGLIPKYLIWGLGMNDPDNGAVNVTWNARYIYLRELCDRNGVNLILCTVPNTPVVDNTYKNAVVRSSGLSYIDYASAVNVSVNSSEWYDGMLSSDNVHPTVEGARALANRLMADMPIISE